MFFLRGKAIDARHWKGSTAVMWTSETLGNILYGTKILDNRSLK